MPLDPNTIIPNILFGIQTGGDDCRSDSRVYAYVYYNDGRGPDVALLKATGTTWDNNTYNQVEILLLTNTHVGDISEIGILFLQGGSGWNGDNWNLDGLTLWVPTPDENWALVYQGSGSPLKRFTGSDCQLYIPWAVAPAAAQEAKMLRVRQVEKPIESLGFTVPKPTAKTAMGPAR